MLVTLTSLFYMYYFTDGRNVVLKYKLAPQTKYILKKKKKKERKRVQTFVAITAGRYSC